jgi:crotonobetainyl-CoA:carnitine CoA-transferase CaiB-like acyl-CoA transferase
MFSGVKIIELASVLAGPSVEQFFAELGAKVIKVILFTPSTPSSPPELP